MSPTTSWLILLAFLAAFCLCADRLTQAIHWLLDHAEHHATRALDGMAHDIDYERFPEAHCVKAREILDQHGWPEDYVRAVVSHGWGICSDVEPLSLMEKTLFAIDELTGLVTAAALVRPSRSVLDLPVKSVQKKWKDKAFAAGVDRGVIEKGAAMLGVDLAELTGHTIDGMRAVAQEIGLKGNV